MPVDLSSKTVQSLEAISQWHLGYEPFARRASVVVLAVQASLCIAAALTRVALHGDGAWFVFTLAADQPWALKWAILSSRAATYVSVVLPTEALARVFHLGGPGIAITYGFIYDFVPTVQFAICMALAWRSHSGLLIFPVAQYILSTALGFGFMSEAFIGPGFFWICLFLAIHRQFLLTWFALCFAGLVFSHDFMLPSALMVAVFAWFQLGPRYAMTKWPVRRAAFFCICTGIFVAWVLVRLSGGGADADRNPLTALDPGRILNNPTLGLVVTGIVLTVLVGWISGQNIRRYWLLPAVVAGTAIPVALQPWLNFADGRYSARTLVGLELFLFAGWAILAYLTAPPQRPAAERGLLQAMTPAILGLALAINVGASAAFLLDWTKARHSFERLVQSDTTGVDPTPGATLLAYQDARTLLSPSEIIANDRMDFGWTWPFRSVVLAPNYRPVRIIFDPETLYQICTAMQSVDPDEGSVPADTISILRTASCDAPVPPNRRGGLGRLIDRLKSVLGSLLPH